MSQYPGRLLPKGNYRIIDFELENYNPDCLYLVRHTANQDLKDDDGWLKASLIVTQTDHLRDVSLNILGIFKPNDCLYVIKDKDLHNSWNPTIPALRSINSKDFDYNSEKGYFFLKFSDFYNQPIPETTVNNTLVIPIAKVIHTPTLCNFWHCSIRWYLNNEDVVNLPKKQKEKVFSTARSFIINNAIFEAPEYKALPETTYRAKREILFKICKFIKATIKSARNSIVSIFQ